MKKLENFFYPKRVAVIGVSDNPEKVGAKIYLSACRSINRVYPVNPRHRSVFAQPCFESVLAIPDSIDLAIIAVTSDKVLNLIKEIGFKKIPAAIIISSGFKEKDEAGKMQEEAIAKTANNFGITLLGPNCLGVITPNHNLSFGPDIKNRGNCAFISQSGALGVSVIDFLNKKQIGLQSFISLGNKTDLSENEIVPYLAQQSNVKGIFCYLESFKSGRDFFLLAKSLGTKKPIIILKPGVTMAAKRAMTSHTGALVSDRVAFNSACRQANLIDAASLENFCNLFQFFSYGYNSADLNSPLIVTNAGGPGILLTDLLPQAEMYDVGGDATAETYEQILLKKVNNKRFIFIIITVQAVTPIKEIVQLVAKWKLKKKVPFFVILPGGENVSEAINWLEKNKIMVFDFPDEAAKLFLLINDYEKNKIQLQKQKIRNFFVKKNRSEFKNPTEISLEFLQKTARRYGLPLNREEEVKNWQDCRAKAKDFGFPVVLKAYNSQFTHKTEKNAVRLNIENLVVLKESFEELRDISGSNGTVGISRMQTPKNLEVIIGIKKDPDFGHVLMFGMGGIYTEIIADLSFGIMPLSRPEIRELISRTKTFKIISGARNLPPLNLKALVEVIFRLNFLIAENPWISELDINPMFLGPSKAVIVDLKIKASNV